MSDDDELFDFDDDEADGGEDLGRFELDGEGSYADVHAGGGAEFDPQDMDFSDIFDALDIDVDQEFLLNQIMIDGLDNYDSSDVDARGPYDRTEVIEFLNDTGWWGIADVYYDADSDSYYVDINYDDGATVSA